MIEQNTGFKELNSSPPSPCDSFFPLRFGRNLGSDGRRRTLGGYEPSTSTTTPSRAVRRNQTQEGSQRGGAA